MKLCEALVGVVNEGLMPAFRTKVHDLMPKIQAKQSGQQLAAMLRNNGVTDEEIKWTKLDKLLKQPTVTKDEIANHLAQHGVPFDIVNHDEVRYQDYALAGGENYGEKLFTYKGDEPDPMKLEWVKLDEPEHSDVQHQWNGYKPGADRSGRYNPPDKPLAVVFADQEGTGVTIIARCVDELGYMNRENVFHQHILNNTVAGCQDSIHAAQKVCEKKLGAVSDSGLEKHYRSNHWGDVKNPVFHVRHQEFTDADGKSLWLIEEIQSDWHQQGRKNGYKGQGKTKPEIRHEPDNGWDWSVYMDGNLASRHKSREDAEKSGEELSQRWHDNKAVANGPMKKSWEEMAFKWALHQAVEAGADRIGWVTGDISADRYDLSKTVGSVSYHERTGEFAAYKPTTTPGAHNGGRAFDRHNVKPDDLSDLIGKELAERLMAAEPNANGYRSLAGLDMKVGGEGMRAAYDQRIVSIARKIAKATGSMVGKVDLQGASQEKDDNQSRNLPFVKPEQMQKAAKHIRRTGSGVEWPDAEDAGFDDSSDESDVDEYNRMGKVYDKRTGEIAELLESGDPELFRLIATKIEMQTDLENEFLDGALTNRLQYFIAVSFGWDRVDGWDDDSNFCDLLRSYDADKAANGGKGGVEVWYMDITDKVKDLVQAGMRLTFESTKPDKWWLIKEDVKPKAAKPWWII